MSKEELISFWKNESGSGSGKKPVDPRKKPGQIPANPAGEQELSDEDLELVEGGAIKSDNVECMTQNITCGKDENSCE